MSLINVITYRMLCHYKLQGKVQLKQILKGFFSMQTTVTYYFRQQDTAIKAICAFLTSQMCYIRSPQCCPDAVIYAKEAWTKH